MSKYQLLFTGDTHGDIENMARFVYEFNKLRNDNPEAIAVFTGDFAGSTIESRETKGDFDIAMLRKVYRPNDIVTLGNHDFNYGEEKLVTLVQNLGCKITAANISLKEGSPLAKLNIQPYYIVENHGEKIAFIGLTTPETHRTSNQIKTVMIDNFNTILIKIEKYIAELNQQDVKNIIVVSHLGIDLDKELGKRFKNLVILGGHSHTIQKDVFYHPETNSIVAHAGYNAKCIGNLQIEFNEAVLGKYQFETVHIVPQLPEDETVKQEIVNVDKKIGYLLGTSLNKEIIEFDSPVILSGLDWDSDVDSHQGAVRINDGFVTATMADALAFFAKQQLMQTEQSQDEMPIGLIHAGSVRTNFREKQNMTFRDIYSLFPFPQYLVVMEVTGKDLIIALEVGLGISNWRQRSGLLIPSAQLKYAYDVEHKRGERIEVESLLINGKPIDPQKKYTIATNDWIASGQDGHEQFKKEYWDKNKTTCYEKIILRDMFTQYLLHQGKSLLKSEFLTPQESFGKRVFSKKTLDESLKINDRYPRGVESSLKPEEVNIKRFETTQTISFDLLNHLNKNNLAYSSYKRSESSKNEIVEEIETVNKFSFN